MICEGRSRGAALHTVVSPSDIIPRAGRGRKCMYMCPSLRRRAPQRTHAWAAAPRRPWDPSARRCHHRRPARHMALWSCRPAREACYAGSQSQRTAAQGLGRGRRQKPLLGSDTSSDVLARDCAICMQTVAKTVNVVKLMHIARAGVRHADGRVQTWEGGRRRLNQLRNGSPRRSSRSWRKLAPAGAGRRKLLQARWTVWTIV